MNRVKWTDVVKPILTYMTLLFMTLRACDVITWPWYLVLSPTIGAIVFVAVCCAVVGIV